MKIIDFWAPWCQPCKQMKPTIESLEKDFPIEKINIDEQPEIAQSYGVMSIPTLLIMDNDKEVKRFIGNTSEADVRGLITQLG